MISGSFNSIKMLRCSSGLSSGPLTLRIFPFRHIFHKHNSHLCYADDTQLYLTIKPPSAFIPLYLNNPFYSFPEIFLNPTKTEVLLRGQTLFYPKPINSYCASLSLTILSLSACLHLLSQHQSPVPDHPVPLQFLSTALTLSSRLFQLSFLLFGFTHMSPETSIGPEFLSRYDDVTAVLQQLYQVSKLNFKLFSSLKPFTISLTSPTSPTLPLFWNHLPLFCPCDWQFREQSDSTLELTSLSFQNVKPPFFSVLCLVLCFFLFF